MLFRKSRKGRTLMETSQCQQILSLVSPQASLTLSFQPSQAKQENKTSKQKCKSQGETSCMTKTLCHFNAAIFCFVIPHLWAYSWSRHCQLFVCLFVWAFIVIFLVLFPVFLSVNAWVCVCTVTYHGIAFTITSESFAYCQHWWRYHEYQGKFSSSSRFLFVCCSVFLFLPDVGGFILIQLWWRWW